MKKMPQMIADYRKQVYELRAKTKKKRTEEEEYLLATGKKQREGPFWQVLKDASKRKRWDGLTLFYYIQLLTVDIFYTTSAQQLKTIQINNY